MRELRKRQEVKKRLYSLPSLVVLVVLATILVKGAYGVMQKNWQSKDELRNLEESVASMQAREAELTKDIARLYTREGVEEEIRKKFTTTQEGEYVAVIIDERGQATSTGEDTGPWYKRLIRIFTNWIK